MALRGNRPDFFAGVGRWGCGFPAGAGTFHPCCVLRGDRRRDAPSLRRCCNGTRLPAQIAGFFCGVGRWGGGFPADAKVFSFCGVVVTGQGPRRKLPGFFAGVGRLGGWVPGGCEGFFFLRRCCNGTRLPVQIASFFAGLAGGGAKLLQRAGQRRKGADDCGFYARRRVWGFCGGGGRAFLRFYYKSGGCVAFRGLRRYNILIG